MSCEKCPIDSERSDYMGSDFSRFSKLYDLHSLEISKELTPTEKKKQFLSQTGSSTQHRVGDYEVECSYGSMSLEKILSDMICG